jgi:hypothetical protein
VIERCPCDECRVARRAAFWRGFVGGMAIPGLLLWGFVSGVAGAARDQFRRRR